MKLKSILRKYEFPMVIAISFVSGAALEFLMIHLHVGQTNFYKVYKERRSEEIARLRLSRERNI